MSARKRKNPLSCFFFPSFSLFRSNVHVTVLRGVRARRSAQAGRQRGRGLLRAGHKP